ncbi:hypothetical protein APHAL10511_004980 [Amanita phalloides]|nr:hypothetical protein APHAL10511_004980 [Amanita phalloides]
MPPELLLDILSYMQVMPIPCIHGPTSAYKEKRMAFCALSRTCRSLRSALLPFVWERIEVCTPDASHCFDDGFYTDIATDLLQQLEAVTSEPSFASFVNTVNVMISGYSGYKVLREFARCLALMPNLRTIQIIDILDCPSREYIGVRENTFKKAFKSYTFPSITHVILSPRAHGLFHCFPNARRVYLNQTWMPCQRNGVPSSNHAQRKWLIEVAKHCRNVEEFGCSKEPNQNFMELVIPTLPKLRSVQIQGDCIGVEFIRRLHELRNLEKIKIVVSPWTRELQEKRGRYTRPRKVQL